MKKPRYIETRKSAIKAIKASIKHWQEDKIEPLMNGSLNVNMTTDGCALCKLYYEKDCYPCPLNKANMRCESYNPVSPWAVWKAAYNNDDKTKELIAAKNMVRVLKSLLPKDEK